MDPTSLPTDNLYKFVALGSLVAIGGLWYAANKNGNLLYDRKKAVPVEQEQLMHRLAHIRSDIERSGGHPSEQLTKDSRDAELKEIQLNAYVRALNELTDFRVKSNTKAFGLMFVLSVIAVVGFSFWYCKLQWFQDRATFDGWREQRARADMAELELGRAKSGRRLSTGGRHDSGPDNQTKRERSPE
jgi:hypothetical protein